MPLQGLVQDREAVRKTLQGAYGTFVNTDTFTLGEATELHVGIRIYELARGAGVKHFVWSSLEYKLKASSFPASPPMSRLTFP